MADIIKEILKNLPENKISDVNFEGANIVLYTKHKDFFLDNNGMIKRVVDDIKKRVELRPDPSITMDIEKAEKTIKKMTTPMRRSTAKAWHFLFTFISFRLGFSSNCSILDSTSSR